MFTLRKTRWLSFGVLLLFILASNVLIYRFDALAPLPKEVALGSLIDLIILLPLITYFLILRKRHSLKYLPLVALAGYAMALLIIPDGFLAPYSFVSYILLIGEGTFIMVELYIALKIITKLPSIIKSFRTAPSYIPSFSYRMEQALRQHVAPSRLLDVISSEITMLYYSLFSWRTKQHQVPLNTQTFTYHKKTSAIAFYIMVAHGLVLESVGFHFLLHSWNEAIAIISLLLNLYTLLFLLAEMRAITLCPFMMTNEHLYLQVGIRKQLIVPIDEIKSFHYYDGPEKLSKNESSHLFDAVLTDFTREKPTFEIEFHTPQEAVSMYGFKKKVTKAHLRVDEPEAFFQSLNKYVQEVNDRQMNS